MLDKPKRPKQLDVQDRQPPRTLQELINRYDLDNTKIYDFLDGLVEEIDSKVLRGKGIVPVDDLNDLKETGIYFVGGTSVANAPSTFATWYGVIVVNLNDSEFIHQYACKPSSGNFAIREHSGNPASWKSWKSITLS